MPAIPPPVITNEPPRELAGDSPAASKPSRRPAVRARREARRPLDAAPDAPPAVVEVRRAGEGRPEREAWEDIVAVVETKIAVE